jgi:putative oligomerization/nucleic acid binding protein
VEDRIYNGYNGNLILTDSGVIIKRGAKGFWLGGLMLRGEKTIPYSSIAAVQLKKAGMATAGFIQLTLIGGPEAKAGYLQSLTDENSITFQIWNDNNKRFEEAKQLLEQRVLASRNPALRSADELAKFAQLRDKSVITEEEFQKKKKQILDVG